MGVKTNIVVRLMIFYGVILVVMAMVMVNAFILMTVNQQKWMDMKRDGNKMTINKVIEPNRGDICACDGRILSTSIPYYELRFDPVAVSDTAFRNGIDGLCMSLSAFFKDLTPSGYRQKILAARNHKPRANRYLLINRRQVDYSELKEISKFPIFRRGKNQGGFNPILHSKRIEPHKNLASRTIGYISATDSTGRVGIVGLENSFEEVLKGTPGYAHREKMGGSWIDITDSEAVDGLDVFTTIDVDYQDIVQHALLRQLDNYGAQNGSVILMDVKTGDIKAIANLTRQRDGSYMESENLALSNSGEPGSVIKAATMVCILEDGKLNIHDTVDLGGKGYYMIAGSMMRDSHGQTGKISVKSMFEQSLNGLAKVVYDLYRDEPKRFVDRWYRMGLNENTGIDIPGEIKPLVKYPTAKDWSKLTLPWMSVGYELKINPLQLLCFYNAIANDGQRMKPRIVTELRRHGEVVKTFDVEEVGSKICGKSTLSQMKELLEGVVEEGTAKNIKTDKYKIAGKTGTARISAGKTGYVGGSYRASFVGYFPADNPLFSCVVVINNPSKGSYYGNVVSGNVFREVSDKVYAMSYTQLGEAEYSRDSILPQGKNGNKKELKRVYRSLDINVNDETIDDSDWITSSMDSTKKDHVIFKSRTIDPSLVPNVKGMTLKDAVYLLESCGLRVGSSGSGRVVEQSLNPGSHVVRGSYVTINLK